MTIAAAQTRARQSAVRRQGYDWVASLPLPAKVVLAVGMAGVTGLAAQLRFPLPGTPVPFTMQVSVVLLTGLLLWGAWGGLSQAVYVAAGLAGVPWFQNGTGGLAVARGVTMGYLVGFVVAAWLIGDVLHRCRGRMGFVRLLALMTMGVVVIWLFGAFHIGAVLGRGVGAAWWWGMKPFVGLDLAKAAMVAAIGGMLLTCRTTDEAAPGPA
jgi:biotin transport system substrate-specific component